MFLSVEVFFIIIIIIFFFYGCKVNKAFLTVSCVSDVVVLLTQFTNFTHILCERVSSDVIHSKRCPSPSDVIVFRSHSVPPEAILFQPSPVPWYALVVQHCSIPWYFCGPTLSSTLYTYAIGCGLIFLCSDCLFIPVASGWARMKLKQWRFCVW